MYEIYAEIRDRKGYKDADVARGAGLSPTVFSEWKNGKSNPKVDKLEKIAAFLNVPIEMLVHRVSNDAYAVCYYKDKAAADMAQKLFDSPGRQALFEAVADMDEATIQKYADFIKGITDGYNKNN